MNNGLRRKELRMIKKNNQNTELEFPESPPITTA